MANTHLHQGSHFAAVGEWFESALTGLFGRIVTLNKRVSFSWKRAQTIRALSRMPSWQLRDIGIDPMNISGSVDKLYRKHGK
ncbi:MAG: DUF1127 domain-containing protein [Pseudomonadota bacterium]